MKLITFVGIERCDFPYYVARLLATQSPNVIVIDNSKRHELYTAVCDEGRAELGEVVTRSGITYLRDIDYSPDFFNSFDYVIVYDGLRRREEDLNNATLIFAMPDFRPYILDQMKGFPDNTEYIIRDAAGKLNERSAAAILDVNEEKIVGCIPFDAGDYASYISLLYNGRQKLVGLSPEYLEGLAYVSGRILEMSDKQAIQLVKKERKS